MFEKHLWKNEIFTRNITLTNAFFKHFSNKSIGRKWVNQKQKQLGHLTIQLVMLAAIITNLCSICLGTIHLECAQKQMPVFWNGAKALMKVVISFKNSFKGHTGYIIDETS